MNLLSPFTSKEAGRGIPQLSPEQIEVVVARFAVRAKSASKGEASINRQHKGINAEMAAEALKESARKIATTTTGNIATGGEYGDFAATLSAVGQVATKPAELGPPVTAAEEVVSDPANESPAGAVEASRANDGQGDARMIDLAAVLAARKAVDSAYGQKAA